MRASHVPTTGTVTVTDWPDPHAREPGQLVVRMLHASICGSDLHAAFHGLLHAEGPRRPGYPGHEGVGVVVESRSERVPEGTLVLTVPQGEMGGCFAELQLLDDLHVVELPAGTDPDDSLQLRRLMMAQQYGTCLYAMRQFWPVETPARRAHTCVVMGAGSAGLFFVEEARRLGFAHVVASDLDAGRLDVARRLGAVPVRVPEEDLAAAVAEVTGGRGADLVIEAVGHDVLRDQAVELAADRGIVGFFGLPERHGHTEVPLWTAFRKNLRLQCSVAAQAEPGLTSFREALRRISEGEIDVEHCLGPEFPLERIAEAMQRAEEHRPGDIKLTITP
ncbi:zinc-binding dehydrogenase [Kocuria sp. CPCC 205263]|uniref:zinc-binding dehydrogenase n=1 Tax=Kocuria sp. CPCC 205263 TaxID=3073555 RepID=UPI0034D4EED5